MIIGNMGLVTVFATVVVSMVNADGDVGVVAEQVGWLLAGLVLLWFLMLNRRADRLLCSIIGRFLKSTTFLGKRSYQRLLQVGDGYSVCEHPAAQLLNEGGQLMLSKLKALDLSVLVLVDQLGGVFTPQQSEGVIKNPDKLILFGRDSGHESLGNSGQTVKNRKPGRELPLRYGRKE